MTTLQWQTVGLVSGVNNNIQGNNIAAALATFNQGVTAPTIGTTGLSALSGLMWHDTGNNQLKIRDQSDTAWIALGSIDEVAKAFAPAGIAGKNVMVNGRFDVSQRYGSASQTLVSGSPIFLVDQWQVQLIGGATVAAQQVAVTGMGGATNGVQLSLTTTNATVNAGDNLLIFQNIEGQRIKQLLWGSASAKPVSIGFWAKSTISGTFGWRLFGGGGRSYVGTFSLVANTPKFISLPNIAGDTAGTWATDNTTGIQLAVTIMAGTTGQTATLNAWQNGNFITTNAGPTQFTTQVNGTTFTMTEVQLEQGPNCTSYDTVDYSWEILRCQRYLPCFNLTAINQVLANGQAINSTQAVFNLPFFVPPRTTPTGVTISAAGDIKATNNGGTGVVATAVTINNVGPFMGQLLVTCPAATFTAGNATHLYSVGTTGQIVFTGAQL